MTEIIRTKPIDVTDGSGTRVIGTVEAIRDTDSGALSFNFDFLTTREVCTIDRDALALEMRGKLMEAFVATGRGYTK